MPNIHILPVEVRNLIAAGEVVERPFSVVKELVENSIDAGATEIKVEISQGGLEKISITDNGCGMGIEDLSLCVVSHATSKLKCAEDLDDIRTMGFRGEALPSIAAVSKLTIESKSKSENVAMGNVLRVEGGVSLGISEKGLPDGTKITVADLFYNVPARKKFIRTPRTEFGHIKDMLERLALANPEIRFQLISDGKEIINAFTLNDQRSRMAEIFGSDVVKNSYDCDADAGEIRVYGLVGDPALAADGSKGFYWFVNRRPVRDRLLNHAASEAFRSLLPRGLNPFSMLFINISPQLVDVNVHPTKSEVRFLKGNAVHDFVVKAVRQSLAARGSAQNNLSEVSIPVEHMSLVPSTDRSARVTAAIQNFYQNYSEKPSYQHELQTPGRFGSLRIMGQLSNSFIICEDTQGKLVVIDQHAAHERIGYEKLKKGYERSSVASQRLLIPEVVAVASKNIGYLESAIDDLNKIGWEIEPFGENNFCVKSVPAIIGDVNLRTVIANMAEELSQYAKIDSHEDKIDMLLKMSACHAQVRAGDRLVEGEMRHLLREMDDYEWAGRCPHGRPAVKEISREEIGKWFERG